MAERESKTDGQTDRQTGRQTEREICGKCDFVTIDASFWGHFGSQQVFRALLSIHLSTKSVDA